MNFKALMNPLFTITNLETDNTTAIRQCAALLVESFREHWPEAWPDMDSALKEVREMLSADRICRIALDEKGEVVGWIGGIPEYDGNVWELHPLVVKPDQQQRGIGRALVQDFEAQVKARGGLTIRLGSDDEDDMTSLANADLYTDLGEKIANIRNFKGHPYEFYQKMGYTIVGVVPDANGRGKPDILMAKQV
jgi:aminoglycoside 6'-N-acetyltransferase I